MWKIKKIYKGDILSITLGSKDLLAKFKNTAIKDIELHMFKKTSINSKGIENADEIIYRRGCLKRYLKSKVREEGIK